MISQFKPSNITWLGRLAIPAVSAIALAGCTNPLDVAYGNSGVPSTVVSGQEKDLRRLDLAVMLDPQQKRKDIPVTGGLLNTDADVIRARMAFSAYENNFPEYLDEARAEGWTIQQWDQIGRADVPIGKKGEIAKCSANGRTHGVFDRTTQTKMTVNIVRTRIDTIMNKNGDKVFEKGTNNDKFGEIKVEVEKAPEVKWANICELERRQVHRRNEIIDQLISASDTNCTRYFNALGEYQSDINLFSSLATVGLGVAGALVSGGAQTLAAAAGATGSVPTAFNEAKFRGAALDTVHKAINKQREQLATAIKAKFRQPPGDYSIAAALKDASEYHNTCSIEFGLMMADEAVSKFNFSLDDVLKAAGVDLTALRSSGS